MATQDYELRQKVRRVPGTPVMYLHHCAPVLERPSEMSAAAAETAVQERANPDNFHSKVIKDLKKKELGLDPAEDVAAKRKRKRKEPNPLSVKKKKKKGEEGEKKKSEPLRQTKEGKVVTAGKKQKRNRKKATQSNPQQPQSA